MDLENETKKEKKWKSNKLAQMRNNYLVFMEYQMIFPQKTYLLSLLFLSGMQGEIGEANEE